MSNIDSDKCRITVVNSRKQNVFPLDNKKINYHKQFMKKPDTSHFSFHLFISAYQENFRFSTTVTVNAQLTNIASKRRLFECYRLLMLSHVYQNQFWTGIYSRRELKKQHFYNIRATLSTILVFWRKQKDFCSLLYVRYNLKFIDKLTRVMQLLFCCISPSVNTSPTCTLIDVR